MPENMKDNVPTQGGAGSDVVQPTGGAPFSRRAIASVVYAGVSLVLGLGPAMAGASAKTIRAAMIFAAFVGLAGVYFGVRALLQTGRSPGAARGRGLAVTGLVVSALLVLGWGSIHVLGMANLRREATEAECVLNVQELTLAGLKYVNHYEGHLPPGQSWCDVLKEYTESSGVFRCPARPERRSGYAMNENLAGQSLGDITAPGRTVLFFESGSGWNATGGRDDLLDPGVHGGKVVIGFVDGHAGAVPVREVGELKWAK